MTAPKKEMVTLDDIYMYQKDLVDGSNTTTRGELLRMAELAEKRWKRQHDTAMRIHARAKVAIPTDVEDAEAQKEALRDTILSSFAEHTDDHSQRRIVWNPFDYEDTVACTPNTSYGLAPGCRHISTRGRNFTRDDHC